MVYKYIDFVKGYLATSKRVKFILNGKKNSVEMLKNN